MDILSYTGKQYTSQLLMNETIHDTMHSDGLL